MPFDDRFTNPRDGHELASVDTGGVVYWCLRCGVLWLDRQGATGQTNVWEIPDQSGRSKETVDAPPCRPSAAPGEDNLSADGRLMLIALTRGWSCERVVLATGSEGWRWSRLTPVGIESASVEGPWRDGPALDSATRRMLATTSG